MTIKQIILLILATVIVSQTNAMDRIPRQSHSSSNQGHPHSFFNQGQVVNFGKLTHNGPIFNSGSLINYGNMIINYPVPPVYSHQPQYFMQPGNYAAYQAKQRMEKQAEECEKQKAQQKCYNELQELNEVRDFLPEKQAQQIDRILSKLSSKEGHAIAEIVIPQLNKIPEVQDVKPFIHILRDTKQPIITKQSQSTSENKSIFFGTPDDFLKNPVKKSLWPAYENSDVKSPDVSSLEIKTICEQLELMKKQHESTWERIVALNN